MHVPSTTLVLMLTDIESGEHYRTTFTAAADAPVYVMVETPEQRECQHPMATHLGRFGDAACAFCSAPLWSLRWLATEVFGPSTVAYGATEVETLHEAMRMSGVVVLDAMERQILAAMSVEDVEDLPALAAELGLVTEAQVEEVMASFEPKHRDSCGPRVTPKIDPPAEVIAADLNPDQPARRRGIPVPHMDLVDVDGWTPDPAA